MDEESSVVLLFVFWVEETILSLNREIVID